MTTTSSPSVYSPIFLIARENIVRSLRDKGKRLITDPEKKYEDLEAFFKENTNYLNILLRADICEQKTGKCFLAKVKLIKWVIDESIEDDHVGIDQWTEILEILAMQVGRLTLERYNTSDKYAYNMNEEAKAHNKKWGEITDQEDKDGEDQKRQRWLHSTWHHFKWYDQTCKCYQCLEFVKRNPLQLGWRIGV